MAEEEEGGGPHQGTRHAVGARAMHRTSHLRPRRIDGPSPRSRPRASRRGLQHSSTSVPDDEPEPDESKRHGWWHFAATLVQSRWRGWAGRRRYLRRRRAARLIQAHYRRWRSRRLVRARLPRRFVTRSFTDRDKTRTRDSTLTSRPPLSTPAGSRPRPRRARRRGRAHRRRVASPRSPRALPRATRPGARVVPIAAGVRAAAPLGSSDGCEASRRRRVTNSRAIRDGRLENGPRRRRVGVQGVHARACRGRRRTKRRRR